jgi:O-antigen/teichoic acid export membrane protein
MGTGQTDDPVLWSGLAAAATIALSYPPRLRQNPPAMSRFRRAVHGVASSYVLLAATAFYSLASVPVALHYLDKERFGLWALMGSLINYLSLIDAGMSGAAARLFIDHKDDRDGGRYGSFIQTGWLVSLTQGAIILITGLVFANSISGVLAIPAALHSEFIHLLYLQCAITALNFATRIFNTLLYVNQRMELSNYTGTFGLGVNFGAMWLFFHLGFGVISLALGGLCALVSSVIFQGLACVRFKLFPERNRWGQPSWLRFKEIFAFGKDLFLVSVGWQLMMASQTIIITRLLGLEAAALWYVGLRMFNLVSQVVWRVADMAAPALAEMMARGESGRLRERYQALAMLTASLSGFLAVSFALGNSLFIPLWTRGKFQWPVLHDGMLGLWLIVLALQHCHSAFVLTTKQIGFMRYVYFVEGMAFVALAFLVAHRGGLAAIIACSVGCNLAFSGAYCAWRITRYFNISVREVGWDWQRPMFKVLVCYLPAAGLTWWLLMPASILTQLMLHALLAGSVGFYLLLRFGVPGPFQTELLRRAPGRFVPLLKRAFH